MHVLAEEYFVKLASANADLSKLVKNIQYHKKHFQVRFSKVFVLYKFCIMTFLKT